LTLLARLVPVALVPFFVDFASCRACGRPSLSFAFGASNQVNDHSFILAFENNATPALSGNFHFFHVWDSGRLLSDLKELEIPQMNWVTIHRLRTMSAVIYVYE
jgi:hypothetical protein